MGSNLTTREHTEIHADKIEGYRVLSDYEIQVINSIKGMGLLLDDLLEDVQDHADPDPRWLALARTDLQTGIMRLVRSVAKPGGF